ncbi:MAG: DoxX family protein [Acidimicrobiales bacterium]|nr:DoxX family protein [Acidimicrobiaceae bacterium]
MNTSTQITIAGSDLALLIFRSSIGITIAAHGWNKIFGGGRIKGTSRWFQSIGMKLGTFNAWMAALSEILCGLLLCLGFLTSFAASGVIGIMIVAGWTVHKNKGFFIIKEGWEYVFILSIVSLTIAVIGPGNWSLDHVLEISDDFIGWNGFWIAGGLGISAGLLQLSLFFRPEK